MKQYGVNLFSDLNVYLDKKNTLHSEKVVLMILLALNCLLKKGKKIQNNLFIGLDSDTCKPL